MRIQMPRRLGMTLVILAVVVTACGDIPSPGGTTDGSGDQGSITTAAPDTTSAPDTSIPDTTTPDTSPPETTVPDTAPPTSGVPDDDGGLDASTIWLVVGLVLVLILLGWLMGRSRRPAAPTAPVTAPTWRDRLREGYGEARWLSDGMTEELAIWRGNSLASTAVSGAGTGMADRWDQLDNRANRARDLFYQAEAGASDPTSSQLVRDAIVKLDAARASVDARAEARLVASRSPGDAAAAEGERIASTNLAEARAALDEALRALSGLV